MNKKYILGLAILLLIVGFFVFNSEKPENIEEDIGAPVSGKIDINAVCDGALAYMTFPDGVTAEQFVADCKEGKYPEVIEQWKKDNGITNDQAI